MILDTYRCPECDTLNDKFHKSGEDPEGKCEKCGAKLTENNKELPKPAYSKHSSWRNWNV